jgi:hypothetical protein
MYGLFAFVAFACVLIRVFTRLSEYSVYFASLTFIYYGLLLAVGAAVGYSKGRPICGAACAAIFGLIISLFLFSRGLTAPGLHP